jgi:hypothetical protein
MMDTIDCTLQSILEFLDMLELEPEDEEGNPVQV